MVQYLSDGFHVFFFLVFGVDEDIIEIYYYKNVKLFCKDLIDIVLKRGYCISQSKKHYLILEIAIAGPKSRFLFITFSDLHPIISVDQVKLGEMSSLT